MDTILYFFSGAGNSLWLTRKIQGYLPAQIIPIASTLNEDSIHVKKNIIGIITPVYYGDLPNIVKDFLNKLRNIENKYIFLVVNYGGGMGHSVCTAKQIVKQKGGEISMIYSIHMPQVSFLKQSEKPDELYAAADRVLSTIQKVIIHKKKGRISTNSLSDAIQDFLYAILKPMYRKHLLKLSSLDKDASVKDAIYKADRTYTVNENCNGCGTCESICLVNNIKLKDGKPMWLHHCENCLACYNWCPQKAISGPLVEENYYYRHPGIKIKDMLNQKQGFLI